MASRTQAEIMAIVKRGNRRKSGINTKELYLLKRLIRQFKKTLDTLQAIHKKATGKTY